MKQIQGKEKPVKEIVSTGSSFEGYTIEEIRFQRAMVAMEAEFCKTRFLKNWSNIQKANPLSPSSSVPLLPGKAGSVALKLINGLNYMDYILLGLSVFKGSRKIFSFFRRNKKK